MWVLFIAKRSVLFRLHHLHGGVVHNHAVKRDVWVAWGNLPATLQEQSVTKFPVRAKRPLLTLQETLKYELFFLTLHKTWMLLKSIFVIVTHMMLALCTAVTLWRPFSLARRKAYSAILRELLLVIILRLSTTPETLWRKEKWRTNKRQTLLTCSHRFFCFVAWPHVPDYCTLPLCSPWWSWCQCSYGESGLQGGTGSASRWQTSLSLCLCEQKQK